MQVTQYLNKNGYYNFEGNCALVTEQVEDLIMLSKEPNINVMEIGFNAGHSAEVLLKNNQQLYLTSFDLGIHSYVIPAKRYIDETYINRHTLILGDSTLTVPKFISENPNKKFDIIFIDGGHDYQIANQDVSNCMQLAHKDTIVIVDDIMFRQDWSALYTVGPTTVWNNYLQTNKITELSRKEYRAGHGMSWGKYNV